ncbi:MAG: DUF4286 family protein [Gemmatimonadales bacterium]
MTSDRVTVRYEVTLECSESTAPELERWMRNTHIPDVLATGCFIGAHFDRDDGRFRTSYHAAGRADLDRYLAEHAARLRDEFARRFPTGVAVSREIWARLQHWPPM